MLRSFLWAFWWPPRACDLRNFLLQNRQGKRRASLWCGGVEGEEVEVVGGADIVREQSTVSIGGNGGRWSDGGKEEEGEWGSGVAVCILLFCFD